MKAVIVEIKDGFAVALKQDGTFEKTNRSYKIGDTVEIKNVSGVALTARRLLASCAVFVVLFGCIGCAALYMPYTYMTVDVNPSIRYKLNIFDRVIAVEAVNEDAAEVVNALMKADITDCAIDDAIDRTVAALIAQGYLNVNAEDYMVISIASVSQERTSALADRVNAATYEGGRLSVTVVSATMAEVKEAEKLGTTPGKLEIIREMQKMTGDNSDISKWIDVSVKEIIKAKNGGQNTVPSEQGQASTSAGTQGTQGTQSAQGENAEPGTNGAVPPSGSDNNEDGANGNHTSPDENQPASGVQPTPSAQQGSPGTDAPPPSGGNGPNGSDPGKPPRS